MPQWSSPCLSLHSQGLTLCAIHWAIHISLICTIHICPGPLLPLEHIKIILIPGPLHSLIACLELSFPSSLGCWLLLIIRVSAEKLLLRELSQLLYFNLPFNTAPISMTYFSVIQDYFCYITVFLDFVVCLPWIKMYNACAGAQPNLLIQHLKIYLELCWTTYGMNELSLS